MLPVLNRLKQTLREHNVLGEFMKTTSKGDATHLARIAIKKGYTTIVAVGGDSTVHEVLNGIAGTDTVLGILPMGARNSIAGKLRIPLEWKKSVETIAARRTLKIDVGQVLEQKQYFLLSAGMGLEIEMLKEKNTKRGAFSGLFRNPEKGTRKLLFKTGPFPIKATIDRSYEISGKVYNASVVNMAPVRNIFDFPYEPNFHDGLLELLLVSPVNKAKSSLSHLDGITRVLGKEIHIETGLRQDVHIDGEVIGKTPITFKIAPFQQKVIVASRVS